MLAQKCRLCGERHPLGPCPTHTKQSIARPPSRAATKIIAGLTEAVAGAKGEADPARVTTFDKTAYQREYMRRWRAEHKDAAATALYRHFDADDRLLYVGIAADEPRRARQHSAAADWWPAVVRSTVNYFPTEIEARAAEARAILSETPLHNKRGRKGWIAPAGECPECDERRTYQRDLMRARRAKQKEPTR